MRRALIALLMLTTAAAAGAQARDPAYAAARADGQIGELPDGYLGVVGAPTKALTALVNKINIQRKAIYTKKSASTGATVEEMAFTSGCNLILKTVAGEKYQDPDGNWQTRGDDAPVRDARCV